ncbi:MAG: hypothetical protein CMM46_00220 [Rhodospirillaceae bacterium]|nr:hypothetical protein [Rhodospirillaceae bacterium]|tara:strand:+ start:13184 stop:14089 length:906 start_codon:yes stop_codon:yes gene_type:complete
MTETTRGRRLWFWFLIVLSGGSWGLFFSLARIAREDGYHPLGLTMWQGIGGSILLLSITLGRRSRIPFHGRAICFYVICGIFGTVLPTSTIFYVAPNMGAGFLAITMTLVPLLTYGVSILLGIDRPAALRLAGLVLGFVAILMIFVPQMGAEGGVALFWALLALLIPVSFTTENLLLALKAPAGMDPIALVGVFQLTGALLLLPIVLATGTYMDVTVTWTQAHWVSVLMLVINAGSYTLFLYIIQHTGPVFAAQTTYLATITGVLWGMALFGETHSAWVWGALVILIAGMALVQERKIERS